MILAQTPPKLGEGTGVGSTALEFGGVIGVLINLVFVAGGMLVLYHLVIGALNWINSEGDKERLAKAQKTITNAVIGFFVLIMVWALFFLITTNILGIFEQTSTGFQIKLPSLFQ